MTTQLANIPMVDLLRPYYVHKEDRLHMLGLYDGLFRATHNMIEHWNCSHIYKPGTLIYLRGDINNALMTISSPGTWPVFGADNHIPYIALDGTHKFSSGLISDIDGSETWTTQPGLSVGGWFKFTDLTGEQYMLCQWYETVDKRSWALKKDATHHIVLTLSADGINTDATYTSTATVAADTWYWISTTWTPNSSVHFRINEAVQEITPALAAPIFLATGAGAFTIGANNTASPAYYIGYMSNIFVAYRLATVTIASLYNFIKSIYLYPPA